MHLRHRLNHVIVWKWWILYGVVVGVFAWFSYALTDPNLVLTQHPSYWAFQQWMWHTFFEIPPRVAGGYALLMACLWGLFAMVVWSKKRWEPHLSVRRIILISLLIIVPLLLCYNALSHDVFNYMFNAKMVLVYQSNPHVHVALDFPEDTWTRFMHNTHTAAPYGYGWTALSLIPSLLGMQVFSVTWILFRLFSILGLFLTGLVLWYWAKTERISGGTTAVILVMLSPFVLSEVVMNMHNDAWMMACAVVSVCCMQRWMKGNTWRWLWLALLWWAISVSIKLASVVLLPLFGLMLLGRYRTTVASWLTTPKIALIASILFFIPLLTPQSKWFLPWYLLWCVVWLPLMTKQWWYFWLVGLMVSSTFRYLPWLFTGGYEQGQTGLIAITWLGGGVVALLLGLWHSRATRKISV